MTDGQLVFSKGDCPFQEVIDEFDNASRISVVTFNISQWRDQLLGALKKAHVPKRLITNIPNRRDDYSKGGIEMAKRTILRYLYRLDPSGFNSVANVFFSFENHAKIIKTDKIAYVGSANFSDESQNNWEAGVIFRDANALTLIETEIDELEKNSIRFFGGRMQNMFSTIVASHRELSDALEQYSLWSTRENRMAFIDLLQDINESFTDADFQWECNIGDTGPVTSLVDRDVLDDIGMKIRDLDHIDEKITNAENGDIDFELVEVNNDGDIPDWGVQNAIDSMDRQRDEEIEDIRQLVGTFISQIEDAFSCISNNARFINNTTEGDQPSE